MEGVVGKTGSWGAALPNKYINKSINKQSIRPLPDMEETAPEALEDESSFPLFLSSLLSALIDVKEVDQRLLNGSTQEDGEIEREGGRRMEAKEGWGW